METTSPVQPIEREQNETAAHYLQRLYQAVMGNTSSMQEAMTKDPDNFARMVNHIPTLLKEVIPPVEQ